MSDKVRFVLFLQVFWINAKIVFHSPEMTTIPSYPFVFVSNYGAVQNPGFLLEGEIVSADPIYGCSPTNGDKIK